MERRDTHVREHARRPVRSAGWWVVVASVSAVALAACSSPRPPAPPGSATPYVLGATVDLSGPLAAYGRGFEAAWNGYFDAVDALGGIDGHRVQLDILDDASVPARQVANMRTLLARKVLLVSGITVSDTCALLAPSLSAAHVPELCTTIPATLAVAPPPYVFSMSDPETMLVKAVDHVIETKVHASSVRVATVLPDVAGLTDMGDALAADAAARGWNTVASQVVALSSLSDVAAQAAAVLRAHPDAVVSDIAETGAVPLVRDLRAGGFTGPVVFGNADYPTLATLQDPGVFQVWTAQVADPDSTAPAVRALVSALGTQGVSGVASVNALDIPVEYLGAALAAKALAACQAPCTARGVDQALANTEVNLSELSAGQYGFQPGRNVPVADVDVYAWNPAAAEPRPWATDLPAVQPFPLS
ncbi:MAG TPA: ABC transporter substrate-binding protein [Acidimicrobiales bacterium]|nr:ABC transporter substrate-binding protein [Acidimicrobiales bacterium]